MSEIWVEVSRDTIRGDRDGLVSLRDALNDALRRGLVMACFEDETGASADVVVERVGQ